MKRSLILLLVVALLATMAPTIALATENATLDYFRVAMPIVTGTLHRTDNPNQPFTRWGTDGQLVETHVDSADGKVDSTKLKIVWMTSDKDIVGFADQPDHRSIIQDNLTKGGKDPFPKLDGRSVGVATITGKAYWKNDDLAHDPQLLGTVSFVVEVKPWWENKVTIEDPYDPKEPNKEKTSQTHTYWLSSATDLSKGNIKSVADIPDHLNALEDRAHVHYEPQEQQASANNWAATYGVSELVWSSSDPTIATVDKHGRVYFVGNTGTVTIRATAKQVEAYKEEHTPKFAEITYVIKQSTDPVEPADETFKTLYFTEDELGVRRGCNRNVVNIAKYLELFPKPSGTYQGTTESPDIQGGNYGKADDIVWTSSNENLIWICRDPAHYVNAGGPNNIGTKGPNWHTCYVEVSRDAKPGDKVTITATSKNNPALSDTVVLLVVADDKRTVTFERTSVTVRESEAVTVKVLGNDWTELWDDDAHVTLTSLNPDIARATKNQTGVTIVGEEPGNTTVTLESAFHNFTASIDVTVVPRNGVKSVTVPERYQNITMPLYEVGEKAEVDDGMNTTQVHVNINPSNAWYRATWTSSDPSVAYIVYDGDADYGEAPFGGIATVRAAGVGKCKITVTIDDGINTFTQSMNITVIKAKATKLALNKTKATHYLIKGGDNTLQLIATDAKTDKEVPVTWTTSDKTIAKVNKAGLVTLKKEGTVKITATTKDGYKTEKSCTITVKKLPVKKIALDAKKANMKVGETAIVVYRISPAKAYDTGVTFKSSNKKVVSVDKYGFLTAKKAGKAEITITAKDGSGVTAKLTITVKGVADNANVDVIDVVEDDNLELTLDGIDGIDDLGNEDGVVLNANDVIELAID